MEGEARQYTFDEDGNMVERRCRATLLTQTEGVAEPLRAHHEINPRADMKLSLVDIRTDTTALLTGERAVKQVYAYGERAMENGGMILHAVLQMSQKYKNKIYSSYIIVFVILCLFSTCIRAEQNYQKNQNKIPMYMEKDKKICLMIESLERYFNLSIDGCDYCKKHFKTCRGYAGFSFYCSIRCSRKYKYMFYEIFQNIDMSCESIYEYYNTNKKGRAQKYELTDDFCMKYYYICMGYNELGKNNVRLNLKRILSLFVADGFKKINENEYKINKDTIEIPISSELYTRIYTGNPFLFFFSQSKCINDFINMGSDKVHYSMNYYFEKKSEMFLIHIPYRTKLILFYYQNDNQKEYIIIK